MTSELPDRSRVVVRADVRPALGVLAAVALLGLPLGWVWSRLAPPELVLVATTGAAVPLLGESQHRFDALAVFVLLGFATGVLAGIATWMMRRRRGPVLLLGAVLGSLVAGWIALRTGEALAAIRYAEAAEALVPGGAVERAPMLESPWAVVAAPFGVALVYSTLVACTGADDLGRAP